jgi:hypothetical protein
MGFYDASDAVGSGAERMGVWVSVQPSDATDAAVVTLVTVRIRSRSSSATNTAPDTPATEKP